MTTPTPQPQETHSETPRTDYATLRISDRVNCAEGITTEENYMAALAETALFARMLERELAASSARCARLEKALEAGIKALTHPGIGYVNYMEGERIYQDFRDAVIVMQAALAAHRAAKERTTL